MAKLLSLNAIYASKHRMHYWCNACGEINLPSDNGAIIIHDDTELPMNPLHLYETFWAEGSGCQEYVVTLDEVDGMALGFLLDKSYKEDILTGMGLDSVATHLDAFTTAAKQTANWLAGAIQQDISILLGLDTDPDGDEILVFIPEPLCEGHYKELRSQVIDGSLDIYEHFEDAVKTILQGHSM